jgi:hypothetical protein
LQLEAARIHRADTIPIRAFDGLAIEQAAAAIDRRTALTVSISDGEVRLLAGDHSFVLAMTEYRLARQN